MPTRAIKPRREPRSEPERHLQVPVETAPSIVRQEQMTPGRLIAMAALVLTSVGAMSVSMWVWSRPFLIPSGWGIFLLVGGLAGLLLHAFGEKELVYRRIYGMAATAGIGLGVLFSLLHARGAMGGLFLTLGAPALGLGLLFGLSFLRNETDEHLKKLMTGVIGGACALMLAVGFVGGLIQEDFLMGRGIVYLVLGLIYVAALLGVLGSADIRSYMMGYALGILGVIMMVIALGRSLPFADIPLIGEYLGWINGLFAWVGWRSGNPGAPFLFVYLGVEFLMLSIGVCSDSKLITLTRRELTAYFCSPVAYIVLLVLIIAAGLAFFFFAGALLNAMDPRNPAGVREPIVRYYLFDFAISVFTVIIMVPIITMRLFAEEHRSGTLEVMLTVAVSGSTVVIAKFLAALRFYFLLWIPWALYLVALSVEGGSPFDYRPVLVFAIVLLATGAGFIGMGMFFSSLSTSQVIAAVLTFMGMLALLVIPLFQGLITEADSIWRNLANYISFYQLWGNAAQGILEPRFLLFHISAAVFWVFLTIKVLESRKWR